MSNPNRRSVLLGTGATMLALALPGAALALSTDQARALIGKVVGDITATINSGRSQAQMFAAFEQIFERYADVDIIARSVLGVSARSASAGQMRAFTKAFTGYMSRKYGKQFREFIGGRIEVESARAVKSFYEVRTTAYLKGSAPLDVIFLVSDKSGRDLFFNLYIEGVNIVTSERSEIGAMLDARKGNLDQLIQDLGRAG